MQTNYKCKHCKKSFGDHKAKSFNCPRKGRGNFKGFDPCHTYSPDFDKPEDDKITI